MHAGRLAGIQAGGRAGWQVGAQAGGQGRATCAHRRGGSWLHASRCAARASTNAKLSCVHPPNPKETEQVQQVRSMKLGRVHMQAGGHAGASSLRGRQAAANFNMPPGCGPRAPPTHTLHAALLSLQLIPFPPSPPPQKCSSRRQTMPALPLPPTLFHPGDPAQQGPNSSSGRASSAGVTPPHLTSAGSYTSRRKAVFLMLAIMAAGWLACQLASLAVDWLDGWVVGWLVWGVIG